KSSSPSPIPRNSPPISASDDVLRDELASRPKPPIVAARRVNFMVPPGEYFYLCTRYRQSARRFVARVAFLVQLDPGPIYVWLKIKIDPRRPMSALGQKRTWAVQKGMSALPPIATASATYGMSARDQKRPHLLLLPITIIIGVIFGSDN